MEYDVTLFFYNPNIAPVSEYDKRLSELKKFTLESGLSLVTGDYDIREWTSRVDEYKHLGERSERCRECFAFRLDSAFRFASENDFNAVATTLTVSPHKDQAVINRVGLEFGRKYGIEYIESDFKKNDGYRKSVDFSRNHGFFRQNYCGCIYSKMEMEARQSRKK